VVLALRYENDALGRPFHVGAYRMRPGKHDSIPHRHVDFHEIMGIVDGTGEHLLETGSVRLQPGDAVLIRDSDVHSMRGDPPEGMGLLNVTFPTSVWQGFVDLSGLDPTRKWSTARQAPMWRLPAPDSATVVALFEEAYERYQTSQTLLDLFRFWLDLFALVLPSTAESEGTAGPDGLAGSGRPSWLVAVCRAMRREENLRGGVPRMLELARVSAGYLSRSMRRHYDTTPTAFVVDIRLERAAALLADTTEPIVAVSARCGFASQSYFSRCFTAAHGVTPREFRQAAQRGFVP
jgi:AraC-like DNA-binding protein/mannose-6-phosphate isomerase-like protein (cupin superfamily)